MWIKATPELLVDGAKVRTRDDDYLIAEDGETNWAPYWTEGEVVGTSRGVIYINFGIDYGALHGYYIGRREHESLEVWVEEAQDE